MKKLIYAAVLLLAPAAYAQEFTIIRTPGDSLREAGDMYGAIQAYKKSIAPGNIYTPDDKSPERSMLATNTYNLACAFSRTGQLDSALKYLDQYVQLDRDSENMALTDPDLINLRQAKGWPATENRIVAKYCAKSKTKITDPAYARTLWHMRAKDQAYYQEIQEAEKKTGQTSAVVLALWDLKRVINEENQRQLEALIREKGWPKISQVGRGPATAAFLVIQHADLAKQQKYLPTIEALCKMDEAHWQDYALMYDRIQTSTDKPQRYGSQVRFNNDSKKYELFPLEDASKVDTWRKEAGLQPLAEYLAHWKITWPEPKK